MSREGGDNIDPQTWIVLVGEPMRAKLDGLQRAFWWGAGAVGGAGVVIGLMMPYILRKLGLN